MLRFVILLGLTLGLAAASLFAQGYETGRTVKLRGAVTRIDWVNPRAYVFINVKDSAGTVTNWALEIGNPLELEHDGWKSTLVTIGDVLIVEGTPARGSARRALATSVVLERTGRKVFVAAKIPAVRPVSQPAPRWPAGHIRLGPAPGKKGYWGAASATALVETGVLVPMNRDGLLVNLSDADKVAPFQPWAKAVYEYRQRTLLKDDPSSRCLPPGGPRQFQTPNGFQFIEQPELGRILVLLGGGDRNWRVIYTDGRAQGQGDDLVLTYYGTSVGHWEKDTLVVDSAGFNERFWMSSSGLPHTEALDLTERFSRPDLNTLKYEVTVNDPRTYTRPWSGGWTVQWIADQEIQEYFCEENAESTFVR
jgi:hypothetical protein